MNVSASVRNAQLPIVLQTQAIYSYNPLRSAVTTTTTTTTPQLYGHVVSVTPASSGGHCRLSERRAVSERIKQRLLV